MAGAYDYLEIAKSSEEYRKKIEECCPMELVFRKIRVKREVAVI